MIKIILIILLSGLFVASYAAEAEITINGPNFGIRSPLEDPSSIETDDAKSLNCYGGGFSVSIGPVFATVAANYGSRNVEESNSTGSYHQNIEYTDYSGRILGGYRLFEIWNLNLYFGGAFGYGSAKRIGEALYEPADENEYPPYRYFERDESILTRYFLTGGPIVNLALFDRFFISGYIGVGTHRINRNGNWQSKHPDPFWPEYYKERVTYKDSSKNSAIHTYINCRVKLFSFLGINAGAEKISGPEPTAYAYIPESYFRHWHWDEPTYNVWIGPSFEF